MSLKVYYHYIILPIEFLAVLNKNRTLYQQRIVNIISSLINSYTKEELEQITKNSNSIKDVALQIGYKTYRGAISNIVKNRLAELNISTEHFAYKDKVLHSYESVFCNNSSVSQRTVRRWFQKYFDNSICSICGIESIWNGKELTLILDHINGINNDNRIDNLRMICPNCNSQLNTFAGRNIHKASISKRLKDVKSSKKLCPICQNNYIDVSSDRCEICNAKNKQQCGVV